MANRLAISAALGCIALAAAACAGSGPPVTPGGLAAGTGTAALQSRSTKRASLVFAIRVPRRHRTRNPHLLHQQFIAAATQGLQALAYKANSQHVAKNLVASLLIDLAPGSSACTTNGDGSRSCTAKMTLPPPAVDLEMTTWDQPPSGGTPAGKELAAGSTLDQAIKAGKVNHLSFTLGGVPASLAVVLPEATPVAGTQTSYLHGTSLVTLPIGLEAFDVDGEQIIADDFVNESGALESITMSVTPSLSTCGSVDLLGPSGQLATSITIASPPAAGDLTFEYGQTATAQVFTAAAPCSFAIAASMGSIQAPASAFALVGPELTTYPVTGLGGAGSHPDGITNGPDGNIWFADTGASAIGEVNVQSTPFAASTEYPSVAGTAPPHAPFGITVGPNNNLWFPESAQVGQMNTGTPGTSVFTYAVPTPPGYSGSTALSEQITTGPAKELMWFTSPGANQVYSIATSGGALKPYTPAGNAPAGPTGITAQALDGTNYYLWFTNALDSDVEKIYPNGNVIDTFPTSGTASAADPFFIVVNTDGNLWFTSCTQHSINYMTPSGVVESYVVSGSQPWGLTVGPDNAIWFADKGAGGVGYIDRIPTGATSASQISRYPVGSGTIPKWIAVGSDGALWFTDSGTGAIGRITY
jgi:streptogramin lyase